MGQENIRPKSIAREMFESFRSFSDYIRDYELQRAEGVLLRHLNRVYKVLTQNVPDAAKNDQVREMELYLGSMIRQVDSSLLDEWEKMRDPNFLRGLVIGDYEAAMANLNSPADAEGQPWTPDRLHAAVEAYELEHDHICLDPNARNARHTYVLPSEDKQGWRVQQMLVDPEGDNDWVAEFEVDLAQSRALGEPFLRLQRIGSLV